MSTHTPTTLKDYEAQGLRRLNNGIEVDAFDTATISLSQPLESTPTEPTPSRKKALIDMTSFSDVLLPRCIEYDRDEPAAERLKDAVRDFQSAFLMDADQHAILESFARYLGVPLSAALDGVPPARREEEDVRVGIVIECEEFLTCMPKYIAKFSEMYFSQYAYHVSRIRALPSFLNSIVSFWKRALPEYTQAVDAALSIVRGRIRSSMSPAALILSEAHLGDFNRTCLFAFDVCIDAPQYGCLRFVDDIERATLVEEDKGHAFGPLAKDQVYSELRTKSVDDIPLLVHNAAVTVLGSSVGYDPATEDELPDEVLVELRRIFDETSNTHKRNLIGVDHLNRRLGDGRNVKNLYHIVRIEKSVRQISKMEKYSSDLWLVHLNATEWYKDERKSKTLKPATHIAHDVDEPIVSIWDSKFVEYAGGPDALLGITFSAFYHQIADREHEAPASLPRSWWITNLVDMVIEGCIV